MGEIICKIQEVCCFCLKTLFQSASFLLAASPSSGHVGPWPRPLAPMEHNVSFMTIMTAQLSLFETQGSPARTGIHAPFYEMIITLCFNVIYCNNTFR